MGWLTVGDFKCCVFSLVVFKANLFALSQESTL